MPSAPRITALSKTDLVRLMAQAGSRTFSQETLENDIEGGAPVNPDGTINLINYAAWLVKELIQDGD